MKKREIKQKQILKRILGGFLAVTIAVGSVPAYRSIKASAAETKEAVETASASDAEKAEADVVVEPASEESKEKAKSIESESSAVSKKGSAKSDTAKSDTAKSDTEKSGSSKKASKGTSGAGSKKADPASADGYDPTKLTITKNDTDGEDFSLTGDTYKNKDGQEYKLSDVTELTISEGARVTIETNALNNSDLVIYVKDNLFAMGTSFSVSSGCSVKAKELHLTSSYFENNGSIFVTEEFTMSSYNSEPITIKIETKEDTWIESDGGAFYLEIGGKAYENPVVGSFNGKAINAVGADNDITFEKPDNVLFGVKYNLDKYVTFSDGYKGDWHFEYGYEGTEFYYDGLPVYPGNYVVYVVAPGSNGYKDAESEAQILTIDVLELPSGVKPSVSGLANEYYAKDSVTLNAPSGYQIGTYYVPSQEFPGDGIPITEGDGGIPISDEPAEPSDIDNLISFSNTLSFTKDDLFPSELDGAYNDDITFVFKRTQDGALTNSYPASDMLPVLKNVIFDEKAPALSGDIMADGKAVSVSDGDEVVAEEVKLSVADTYLDKVETQSTTYTRSNGVNEVGDSYKADLTFTATEGEVQNCYVKAYDLAGRLYSVSFKLKHPNDVKEEEKEEEKKEEKKEKKKEKKEDPEVEKKTPDITVSIDDTYYGVNYSPSVKTNSDGKVTYTYANSSVMEFSENKPTMPGTYIVRATVEETEKFEEARDEAEFSISYLPAPGKAYSYSGVKGNNDYYVSDVTLSAPDGYGISTALGGVYSPSKTYIEGMSFVYLQRNSDGARTAGIPINEKFKIDKDAPKLLVSASVSADADITSNDKVYADTIKISLVDEHLLKASVNGDTISVNNGRAEFTLDSQNKRKTFQISAEDEAGNRYSRTVEVSALWLIKSIIPAGVEIELEGGNQ
nr:hypothetical protein [Eubacterium sp.]